MSLNGRGQGLGLSLLISFFFVVVFYTVVSQQSIQKQLAVLILPK